MTTIIDTKLHANSFFLISLDETTSQPCKSVKLLEKEFERPQSKGMWHVTNNINLHNLSSETYNVFKNWGAETVKYRPEIIFKGYTGDCLCLNYTLVPLHMDYQSFFKLNDVTV